MKSCTSLSQRGCNTSFLLPERCLWKWAVLVGQFVVIMASCVFCLPPPCTLFWDFTRLPRNFQSFPQNKPGYHLQQLCNFSRKKKKRKKRALTWTGYLPLTCLRCFLQPPSAARGGSVRWGSFCRSSSRSEPNQSCSTGKPGGWTSFLCLHQCWNCLTQIWGEWNFHFHKKNKYEGSRVFRFR